MSNKGKEEVYELDLSPTLFACLTYCHAVYFFATDKDFPNSKEKTILVGKIEDEY